MRSYVLDANALMILLLDRPGANRVDRILHGANRTGSRVLMSAVNWGEVVYSLWKVRGETESRTLILRIEQLPMSVVPIDRARATRAAELKSRHGLGYADSFAGSLAMELGATLLTADADFKKVGKKLRVEFLPRHESACQT